MFTHLHIYLIRSQPFAVIYAQDDTAIIVAIRLITLLTKMLKLIKNIILFQIKCKVWLSTYHCDIKIWQVNITQQKERGEYSVHPLQWKWNTCKQIYILLLKTTFVLKAKINHIFLFSLFTRCFVFFLQALTQQVVFSAFHIKCYKH